MSTSIWPADYFSEPHDIHREHGNHLIVFLMSPFNPRDRYDELFHYIQSICDEVGRLIGAQVQCVRADSLDAPNVIHQDIWNHIQMADALIADVSDINGNVMLELGVAASIRGKEKVIVIRNHGSEGGFLFDISPARHLIYQRSLAGDLQFREKLKRALIFSLAPDPYVPREMPKLELPLELDLRDPKQNAILISPSNSHRRSLYDGLEFGSFYAFQYSWMTIGLEQFGTIKIRVEMRFTELKPDANEGWMGIMLRSQHFFTNWGHLIFLNSNGIVRHTKPINEFAKENDDPYLGQLENFALNDWVTFDVQFDMNELAGSVGKISFRIPVTQMPFCYNAGLVRFQSYLARACVRSLKIEIPA